MRKRGTVGAVLVAAGEGRRMGRRRQRKAWIPFRGAPLFLHGLRMLASLPGHRETILVGHPKDIANYSGKKWSKTLHDLGVTKVVPGGRTRRESVFRGVSVLNPAVHWVLVHDAARPLASGELARRVLRAARRHGAAIPGVPLADTIKEISPSGRVRRTLDRSRLRAVQTPQGFRRDWLAQAHASGTRKEATDDATLLERAGKTVYVVKGEPGNVKITTPDDLRSYK